MYFPKTKDKSFVVQSSNRHQTAHQTRSGMLPCGYRRVLYFYSWTSKGFVRRFRRGPSLSILRLGNSSLLCTELYCPLLLAIFYLGFYLSSLLYLTYRVHTGMPMSQSLGRAPIALHLQPRDFLLQKNTYIQVQTQTYCKTHIYSETHIQWK